MGVDIVDNSAACFSSALRVERLSTKSGMFFHTGRGMLPVACLLGLPAVGRNFMHRVWITLAIF